MNIDDKTKAEIERIQKWRGKRALIFDTETSGLPRRGRPLSVQPHVIQLAFIFGELPEDSADFVPRAKFSSIIKLPEDKRVDPGAAAVHGITEDVIERFGIEPSVAVDVFAGVLELADVVIGHNVGFDLDRIWDEFMRDDDLGYMMPPSHFRIERECTMELTTDLCNIPPTPRMIASGRNHPKNPKLGESYKHMFGEELSGAHDALVDVEASLRIFMDLLNGPLDV